MRFYVLHAQESSHNMPNKASTSLTTKILPSSLGKFKNFLIGLITTYNDLFHILSKISKITDKEALTCHK
jgi:hypothetical protein